MVLNKLKSRSIKRGKRAKHGKYTKRKGRVHVYHQKYKKHYTRKYGKRIQRRRRSKKGGELTLNIPNMNTPVTILYRYFARITKPDVDSFSEDDKQEQITMYTQKGKPNSIFIARCPSKDCSTETGAQIMEIDDKSFIKDASKRGEYFFSSGGIKYKIKIDDDGVGDVGGVGGVGVTLLDVFDAYTRPKKSEVKEDAEEPVKTPVVPVDTSEAPAEAPVKTPVVPVDTSEAPAEAPDVKLASLSDEEIDSINFKNPTIEDIRKMVKLIVNRQKPECLFLCMPDECDKGMLEKLKQKYIEKIKDKKILTIEDAADTLDEMFHEDLFLQLESLYIQSQILTKKELQTFIAPCSMDLEGMFRATSILQKKIHIFMSIFYKKFIRSISNSDDDDDVYKQDIENMKKLLDLLNSMTPANMQKLLQLLNSMTNANMEKLSDLLKSMTPENIGFILQALNTKFDYVSKLGIKGINSDHSIGLLLSDHLKLDAESMSKLLDFYSFSEIKQSVDPKSKIVRYDIICHKYKGGKTPLLKSISIGKEDSSTCKAIDVLNESIIIFTQFLKRMYGEHNKSKVDVRQEYDAKLLKADNECGDRHYQGGGKRKTLKKRKHIKN